MAKKQPAKKIKESVAQVNRTIQVSSPGGSETTDENDSEEVVSIHEFTTVPAEVEVGVALTMNIGNYESARLTVHLRVPCYKEEVDNAYLFAQKWVEDRIEKEKSLVVSWRESNKKKSNT